MDRDAASAKRAFSVQTDRQLRLVLMVAALVIALDQLAKAWIERLIGPGSSRHELRIAGDWLGFEYVRNRGVAFGVQIGSSTLTLALGAVVFLLIGWSFWRIAGDRRLALIGLGLLAGGAIGNMIDRVRIGAVVDYVAIAIWPRFNIADSAITIGVLLLAASSLVSPDRAESHDLPEEQSVHAAAECGQHPRSRR